MRGQRPRAAVCLGMGFWVLLLLGVASSRCGPVTSLLLDWAGIAHMEEVSAQEAARRLAEESPRLVQVRTPDSGLAALPGALRVRPGEPLPEILLDGDRQLVVVAGEADAALRLGARLARSGAGRVAIVRGDPQDLDRLRHVQMARAGAEAKPSQRTDIQERDPRP